MTLEQQLQSLEGSGLIRLVALRPELEYLFRHALLQEAVYQTLVKQDRKRLHLAVGEMLESAYPGRADELSAVLARHFAEAGDERRALQYHIQAGAHSAQRYANAEAVMHYSSALELAKAVPAFTSAQIGELYTRLGRPLELMGDYAAALANYEAMHADALRRGDRNLELAALVLLAQAHSTPAPTYDGEAGEAFSARALTLARALGDRKAEAKILWNRVNLYLFMGRMDEGAEAAEQALSVARELGDREQLAYILNDNWRVYWGLGQTERALQSVQAASQIWRELHNLPMLTDNLSNIALSYFFAGRYDEALQSAEEALQISRSIQNSWGMSYSRFGVGHIYWDRGDPAQAIEVMETCVQESIQAGFITPQIHTRSMLAWVYGSLGAAGRGRAIALAELAAGIAERALPIFCAQALGVLAILHVFNGSLERAETALHAARDGFAGLSPLVKPIVYLATVTLYFAQRDYPQAERTADEFIDYLARMQFAYMRADAFYLKGCALLKMERVDEARAALVEAQAAAERLGARRVLWQILMRLSVIAGQLGQTAEAAELRRRARAIVLGIAARTPAELRESFLTLPEVGEAFVI